MAKVELTPQSKRNAVRIMARLKKLGNSDSPEVQSALNQIGNMVKNQAIANITQIGMVSAGGGHLRASMQYRTERANGVARVVIGPFGIPYARINEFGGVFTKQMRGAMFASFRERGLPPAAGKGIISGNLWRARPYLIPALAACRPRIKKILQSIGAAGK